MKSDITSGKTPSVWMDTASPFFTSPLIKETSADVVIIGAGITGLSAGYFLAKAGKKVIVLDDGAIGSGETGRTTAHLTYALDSHYVYLRKKYGLANLKIIAQSHQTAINAIENIARKEKIKCSFQRIDGYLGLGALDSIDILHQEQKILRDIGFSTHLLRRAPLHYNTGPCLQFPAQAQFHPLLYLKGLAKSIERYYGRIYTRTHAAVIEKNKVITSTNVVLHAKYVLVATNVPVSSRYKIHTKQGSYRTYVIGGLVSRKSVPYVLYWDINESSHDLANAYHYLRIAPYSRKKDIVIVGGEDHKTGQAEDQKQYERLELWTKKRFPVTKFLYHWSGQVIEPADGLAYIGKLDDIYIATGMSGNGMTYGTIAGILIRDLMVGKPNPWAAIYNPKRLPWRTPINYLHENFNVANQYIDYVKHLPNPTLHYEEGKVISKGKIKIAVYQDQTGLQHSFSAICPHLQGIVRWNKQEKTFDCPCHGSRFSPLGKVLNGPANADLEPVHYEEKSRRKKK